ncbi:hypothetical protein Ccrd_014881 [Cynara cardunculus var. scolymus]|uniref:Pentatricopeptide repeat-containing protein n=1 Tax=Cynara cardunculus var. scolymus TaxID=59895 RepID=A0A124SGL4_CYNCS|nr:hypothetical protein Ccrd_014881 [Cynara cardunculus var. scolymus]
MRKIHIAYLGFFNIVANRRGFNHNHSAYAVTLHKLARSKKFEDVDSVLHQMMYETCKFHDMMTQFSKYSLHKRFIEMFNAITNLITHSTLMEGRLEEEINHFEEMVSKDKILLDALTYNILINIFRCGGKVDRVVKTMYFDRC